MCTWRGKKFDIYPSTPVHSWLRVTPRTVSPNTSNLPVPAMGKHSKTERHRKARVARARVSGDLLDSTGGYGWQHQQHMKTKTKPHTHTHKWLLRCGHLNIARHVAVNITPMELTLSLPISQPPKLLLLSLHHLLQNHPTS